MKAKTIDEHCKKPAGSFKKFIKEKEDFLQSLGNRLHVENGTLRRKTPAFKDKLCCIIAGCGDPYNAKGLCKKHYLKAYHALHAT